MAPVAPDSGWEIWTCSLLPMPHMGLPRWDRHMELHRLADIGSGWDMPDDKKADLRDKYIAFLADCTKPVYVQGKPEQLPNATPYPLDKIIERFPRKYFTSTIAYMMALAIMENVDEIGLWGVDMALNSERYSHQRACLEYFVGIMDGMGMPVHIPAECDLLKARDLYGFGAEDYFVKRLAARKAHVAQQIKGIDNEIMRLREARAGFRGVLDDLDWVGGNHTNGLDGAQIQLTG
jgi:hypothetical protein